MRWATGWLACRALDLPCCMSSKALVSRGAPDLAHTASKQTSFGRKAGANSPATSRIPSVLRYRSRPSSRACSASWSMRQRVELITKHDHFPPGSGSPGIGLAAAVSANSNGVETQAIESIKTRNRVFMTRPPLRYVLIGRCDYQPSRVPLSHPSQLLSQIRLVFPGPSARASTRMAGRGFVETGQLFETAPKMAHTQRKPIAFSALWRGLCRGLYLDHWCYRDHH